MTKESTGTMEEKYASMQTSLTGQLNTVLDLTTASQSVVLPALFGINMVFRFLKFGSRLRKVYAEQRKQFEDKVRAEGVVLMPVSIRPKTTLVTSFFTSGTAERSFPEQYKSMSDQVKIYKTTRDFKARQAAIKKLKVAYFLIKQGEGWRNNKTLMDLANVSIESQDDITFLKMVETLEPLYGKDLIGFDDFDNLLENYAIQDLQALGLNMDKLRAEHISQLRDTVKQMFWDTMLHGDDNAIGTTLAFIGNKKLRTQEKRLARLEDKIDTCKDEDERASLEKKKKTLKKNIQTLEKFKSKA